MTKPFARVTRGDANPADCIRCHRDTDLIDLGVDAIYGYGVVYVCTRCVADLIDQLGYVPREDIATATSDLEAQNALLTEQVAKLKAGQSVAPAITTITEGPEPENVTDAARRLLADLGIVPREYDPHSGQVVTPGVPAFGSALAGGERRDDLGDLGGDAGDAGSERDGAGESAGGAGGGGEGLDILALAAEPDVATAGRSSRKPPRRKGSDGVQPAAAN